MNSTDLDTLLNTPVGTLRAGQKRGREEHQEQKESEEEVSVEQDIRKYSDRISSARQQISESAECSELLNDLKYAMENEDSDAGIERLEEQQSNLRSRNITLNKGHQSD